MEWVIYESKKTSTFLKYISVSWWWNLILILISEEKN